MQRTLDKPACSSASGPRVWLSQLCAEATQGLTSNRPRHICSAAVLLGTSSRDRGHTTSPVEVVVHPACAQVTHGMQGT